MSCLRGPSGKTSAMRVATLFVLVNVFGLVWHSQWTGRPLPTLDPTWMGLILGAMGIQVWHKGQESTKQP